MALGEKALACLRIAEVHSTDPAWDDRYDLACRQYSEKAVIRKMEELCDRGYIECGVSVRTGWLTDKGAQALCEN